MHWYLFFSFLFFISCTKTNQEDLSINAFKNDKLITEIGLKIKSYQSALKQNNVFEIRKSLDVIVMSSRGLSEKYGQDRMWEYFGLLIKEERNINENFQARFAMPLADKCHRNTDGTTNWDECNFFESIAVSVKAAFSCTTPDAGAGESQINEYYDCVQLAICETC